MNGRMLAKWDSSVKKSLFTTVDTEGTKKKEKVKGKK